MCNVFVELEVKVVENVVVFEKECECIVEVLRVSEVKFVMVVDLFEV